MASESDSDSDEAKSPRIPYVNFYRLDREKCQKTFEKTRFDDIVESHAMSMKKKKKKCEHTESLPPPSEILHIKKVTTKIFSDKQKIQTRTQMKAGLKKIENAFSVWYFESHDGDIYVAAEGRSHHYFRHLADHEFPEKVFDRQLDEDVLEVHGQRLLGRVALYSEQYRQVHKIMDNLWQYLNSLMTKVTVPIRTDSELGNLLITDDKTKVFATVNFQNHSVQIRKALAEKDLVPTLDVLIGSFARFSPGRCTLLRLVSRVHDESTRQKLNKLLNDFLASAETCTENAASSTETEISSVALHTHGDEWNSSTVIRLKLPALKRRTVGFSPDVRKAIKMTGSPPEEIKVCSKGKDGEDVIISGRDYLEKENQEAHVDLVFLKEGDKLSTHLTHHKHKEPSSALVGRLHQKFKEKCRYFDFHFWLEKVVVKYGKTEKKSLPLLMECQQQFLLENKSYMFFHGEWLSFHSQFHSLLEVHFLELMKTRSIDSNLILPLPWPNSGLNHSQKFQFGKFFAAWLRRGKVTKYIPQDLKTNSAYDQIKQSLGSSKMTELHYNVKYLLVDQLMETSTFGDQGMEAQATQEPEIQLEKAQDQSRGFLVADGVTVEGETELFDLMYYDKVNVFFIHVKRGFSAKPMRQVVDQVRRSAEYIQCLLLKGKSTLEAEMQPFIQSLRRCKKRSEKREENKVESGEMGSDHKSDEKEEDFQKGGKKRGHRNEDDREGDDRRGKRKMHKRVDDGKEGERKGADLAGDAAEGVDREGRVKKVGKRKCSKQKGDRKRGDSKTTVKKGKTRRGHSTCHCDDEYKWACDLDKRSARKFTATTFAELLISHKLHFVLAYGGRGMEDKGLHTIEGKEIQDALRKNKRWILKLEEKGYITCNHGEEEEEKPPAAKKARRAEDSYALTRRFCLADRENFLQDMTYQTPEEKDDLENLFECLKAAISKTDFNTSKMAFLNVFESFKNFKDLTLWFCRIAHRSPEDEDIEEISACLENMHLWPQG